MIIKCLQLFSDCSNVSVNLKNEVLNQYEYLQGDYQISTTVNGEPSWKNGAYAIWFMSNNKVCSQYGLACGKWIIGPLNRIGEDYSLISSDQVSSQGLSTLVTNIYNHWNFWNGSSNLRPSEPKAIQITCNGKYFKHLS